LSLEVSDTGIGMSEEARRRCLEPFFSTKGVRGTGLGLAMVYGMTQRHGADLDIKSELGLGTTVRIVFPTTFANTPPVKAPRLPLRPLNILAIDDDPLVLKSVRQVLEADGHRVTTADGGQAGVDAFVEAVKRCDPYAVVVSDLAMPYVDGNAVAAAIKLASPTTPVIILTGWGQGANASPLHADRVLGKPAKLADLRQAIAELCDRQGSD
jgi:CheY-like chemotaxis protein